MAIVHAAGGAVESVDDACGGCVFVFEFDAAGAGGAWDVRVACWEDRAAAGIREGAECVVTGS